MSSGEGRVASVEKQLTPETRAKLAKFMREMPFVTWDRWVGSDSWGCAYGWIDREDAYKDFVYVWWYDGTNRDTGLLEWTISGATSSEKYSIEIQRVLQETPAPEHDSCVRIEDEFNDLVPNAVRLNGPTAPKP